MEEKTNESESVVYKKRVIEVPKGQIEMCPRERRMKPRSAENEKVSHPTESAYFSTMESRVHHRLL